MKCCLCGGEIIPVGSWTDGNNAEPVMNGRCCDLCNSTKVIPARLKAHGVTGESKSVFCHAVFSPKTGMFIVKIDELTLELPVNQFMSMVQYLGKVATSYQQWLKKGGKL